MTPSRLSGLLLVLLPLGGCGFTPQELGITGPGTGQSSVLSHASDAADPDAVNQPPGLPVGFGTNYGPSLTPQTGGQTGRDDDKFYGYN